MSTLTPPTIVFNPVDSATKVPVTSNIRLIFNEPIRNIDNSEITDSNVDSLITLRDTNSSGSNIGFDATISSNKKVITINPNSSFSSEQVIYVAIGATVENDSNAAISASSITFEAADSTAPRLTFNPFDSEMGVAVNSNITITFDEAVRNTDNSALTDSNVDGLIRLKTTNSSGSDIDFDATIDSDKKVITINPDIDFSDEQVVYVAIGATVEDDSNNAISASSITFVAGDSSSAPILLSSSPADGAIGVGLDGHIVLTFNEAVEVGRGNILIKKSFNNSTVETIDVTSSKITGTGTTEISFIYELESSTDYYITIDTTAFKDIDGNAYGGITDATGFNFTTMGDTTSPVIRIVPVDSQTGVAADSNITITSDEVIRNIDNSSLTNSNVGSLITLKKTNSSGSDIAFVATIDSDKKVITINPTVDFSSEQVVYVAIGATVEDGTNNAISERSVNFTVVDYVNPVLSSSSPADGATGIAVDANIVLIFNEAVDVDCGNIVIRKTSDDSIVETIDVTGSNVTGTGTTEITINLSETLDSATGYYLNIDTAAFDDTSGNSYTGITNTTTLSFTTFDPTSIERRVTDLEAIDHVHFDPTSIEARVTALETGDTNVANAITTLTGLLTTLQSEFDALQTKVQNFGRIRILTKYGNLYEQKEDGSWEDVHAPSLVFSNDTINYWKNSYWHWNKGWRYIPSTDPYGEL